MKLKRPHQAFPLVEVWWDDATELPAGWKEDLDDDEPVLALSVGFLIREAKDHIVLAQDLDGSGHHNGRRRIPRGMVKKMNVLRKKDQEA